MRHSATVETGSARDVVRFLSARFGDLDFFEAISALPVSAHARVERAAYTASDRRFLQRVRKDALRGRLTYDRFVDALDECLLKEKQGFVYYLRYGIPRESR